MIFDLMSKICWNPFIDFRGKIDLLIRANCVINDYILCLNILVYLHLLFIFTNIISKVSILI